MGSGRMTLITIYERIEYLASGLETKVVFLDHLSILLSGLDGDERQMIDRTMTRLRSLVERTGISLFLVCHTTSLGDGQSRRRRPRSTSTASEVAEVLDNCQMQLLHSKEISRANLNEMLRQCEFLKIAIQAKLVSHVG